MPVCTALAWCGLCAPGTHRHLPCPSTASWRHQMQSGTYPQWHHPLGLHHAPLGTPPMCQGQHPLTGGLSLALTQPCRLAVWVRRCTAAYCRYVVCEGGVVKQCQHLMFTCILNYTQHLRGRQRSARWQSFGTPPASGTSLCFSRTGLPSLPLNWTTQSGPEPPRCLCHYLCHCHRLR